ncbi:hypothetical protein ACRAWD_22510 [Caulobacter segnis]
MIKSVHDALARAAAPQDTPGAGLVAKATPAQIRKSITPDALIS